MVNVAAAIILNNSKILIAKRTARKFLGGYWEFPGGKIEVGETPEVCLHRELAEELEISVKIDNFLTEQIYDYGQFVVCMKVFLCTMNTGKIVLNDHEEYKWVEKHELLSYDLAPADIPLVEFYLENGR
ncbi:(deoxy)nucleoside triphosphate pyrophosphohydrolase [Pedobacter sp. D749]|uniref:(deoxy)nucleoside triphosphate pyrophosphohydrolase n=1 Tax=Pedobacter sp. D749 TaxID=2856523 RepID=UPI001C5973C0|nr:(deoxy)nucleoside triphosphate pyrophosphohydrolase [Pedobacter sp. D749]QXU42140.1 (deoxy)nucleoside triphosphate pyrophosphohydrolase [Pedobacter sp. D749]